MEKALFSSNRIDWNTPRIIIELVKQVAPISLDPCSNPTSVVNAATEWSIEKGDNGLKYSWQNFGLVYCNPPYGRTIADWSRKMVIESRAGAEIIGLMPARPDTVWMQLMMHHCNSMVFWRGRLTFLGASATAPFPSCVVYFGSIYEEKFRQVFSRHGHLVINNARE